LEVTPGELSFSLYGEGYKSKTVKSILWPGDKEKFLNFSLATLGDKPGGINGVITASGEPLEGVEVMILAQGKIISVYTNGEGYYEFSNLPSNERYPLIAAKEGYIIREAFIEVSSGVTSRANLDLLPSKGTCIAGFIMDEEGNPVRASLKASRGYISSREGIYKLVLRDTPPSIKIKISAEGYLTLEEDVAGSLVKHFTLVRNI
jgi:hypothetical protein